MSCDLRVAGKKFDAVAYAKRSTFPITRIRPSELTIEVSDAGFSNLKGQIRDAVRFLKTHRTKLRRLAASPGGVVLTLDFGIRRRHVAAQFDCFPPELLLLAGRLRVGLETSMYEIA